ncbi:hypothetical protein Hamer_G029620 [Homarus americanus]|uniref:Uncharacterized protein n=1 Tax=Homarus americanus TaxID=6706 RepID=A0A8J5N4N6_HOMAM|nr:hypothetical protein Hamer_G029620 [Homarus americanus]
MTSSPVVCLIGETEARHFTPQSVLPSLLHLTASPFLTPTPHRESFPHPYTSQGVLPSLLHNTVSLSHIDTHHTESFPHPYTSQ